MITFECRGPASLSDGENAIIGETEKCFASLQASVSILQRNNVNLGEYCPVATAFKDALLDHGDRVSTAFLELLAWVEERHLEKSPGHYMPHGHGKDARRWASTKKLMMVWAFFLPDHRSGSWLKDEAFREEMKLRAMSHCVTMFKEKNPVVEAQQELPQEAAPAGSSTAERSKEKVKGMRDIESRLYGREATPKPKTVNQMVAHDFRRYEGSQAGIPPRVRNPLRWWGEVGRFRFPYLYPGACYCLKFHAGNGPLERLFKDAKQVITAERSCVDASRDLCLRQNAALLGMEHYTKRHRDDADSGSDCGDVVDCDGSSND